MRPVFAVEIADNPVMLLVVGVFLLTFLAVCVIAFVVLSKGRREGAATTWRMNFNARVPVSQRSFERIAAETRAAMSMPEVTPQVRQTLNQLDSARRVLSSVYRSGMILIGVAGLVGGIMLVRSHTPANMQGLPGGIIILLSLGALMSGLVPSRRVDPGEPLAPELLRQMREKISVQVITAPPLEVKLGEAEIRRLKEMLRQGARMSDALRAVHPAYETLGDADRRWLESTLEQHVRDLG